MFTLMDLWLLGFYALHFNSGKMNFQTQGPVLSFMQHLLIHFANPPKCSANQIVIQVQVD